MTSSVIIAMPNNLQQEIDAALDDIQEVGNFNIHSVTQSTLENDSIVVVIIFSFAE